METANPSLTFADATKIVELRTKIVSTSSVLLGTAWAFFHAGAFDPLAFLLLAVSTFCVDLGTAGFNSYYDYQRGVDTIHTDVEQYKVLVHRGVDPRIALWISMGAFAFAAVFGLLLAAHVGWEILLLGAVSMGVAYFYSGGPVPISSTPIGEVFAGGFLGAVLLLLASYVQLGTLDVGALWLGLPSTILIGAILTVNNTCDVEGDARAGRRTLSILVGPGGARSLIAGQVAVTWLIAFALLPLGVVPPLGAIPLAVGATLSVLTLRGMHRRGYTHETKPASMQGVSLIFLVYTLSMLTALALRTVG